MALGGGRVLFSSGSVALRGILPLPRGMEKAKTKLKLSLPTLLPCLHQLPSPSCFSSLASYQAAHGVAGRSLPATAWRLSSRESGKKPLELDVMRQFRRTMAMKTYKPTTPGQRHKVTVRRDHLWKGKPFRALTVGKRSTGGRNNLGRITAFHRGGGHKRRYRFVDLTRSLSGVEGVVKRLEYDPNRSADIALIEYGREHDTAKGARNKYGSNSFVAKGHAYIIAPEGLKPGDKVTANAKDATISPGNAFKLRDIPVGVAIHNIELNPGKGGQMVRSAGAAATLMRREAEDGFCIVKLPSGEQRYVKGGCMATIGAVGNKDHHNRKLGKAGASRYVKCEEGKHFDHFPECTTPLLSSQKKISHSSKTVCLSIYLSIPSTLFAFCLCSMPIQLTDGRTDASLLFLFLFLFLFGIWWNDMT